MKNHILSTSKKNLIVIIFFITLLIIFRFVLPYGDEPDFSYRLDKILHNDYSYWNPFYYFQNLLNQYNWWTTSENIYQKILRLIITLVLVWPLLATIIFKNIFYKFINKINTDIVYEDWNTSISALSLALVFPSMIYYIGVFAEEQLTLVLSLFIFIFIRNPLIVLLFIISISLIDFGNSIVVIAFVLLCYFNKFLFSRFGLKSVIYSCLTIIIISFILGLNALTYLQSVPLIGEKATRIYNDYTNIYSDISGKYPAIFRPVITLITGTFWLPSNFLALYLYPFYFYLLFKIIKSSLSYYVNNFKLRTSLEINNYIFFISGITMITSFPLILNGYSNAKYYVFVLPFIVKEALRIFNYNSIFYFLIISNILVIVHLLVYNS